MEPDSSGTVRGARGGEAAAFTASARSAHARPSVSSPAWLREACMPTFSAQRATFSKGPAGVLAVSPQTCPLGA